LLERGCHWPISLKEVVLASRRSEATEPWLLPPASHPQGEQSPESSFANRIFTGLPARRPGEHAGAFVDSPQAEKNHKSEISVNISQDYVEISAKKRLLDKTNHFLRVFVTEDVMGRS
jgi:hypothetical protein